MINTIKRVILLVLTILISSLFFAGCQRNNGEADFNIFEALTVKDIFPWIIAVSVILLCVLGLAVLMLMQSRRMNKEFENLVKIRTSELEMQSKNLAMQTAMLTTLFDSIPDLVFVKDLNLRFIHFNQAFANHFELSKEEIMGKHDSEVFHTPKELVEQFNEIDRKVIREGITNTNEELNKRADGTPVYFETKKVPMKADGGTIGVMGIARDISKRKELEKELAANYEYALEMRNEAEAANHSKTEFLANMSHEIRTPMNSIIGFTELALNSYIPTKAKDYLYKVLQNSEWLLQIINDILDISKIESGHMELERIPFILPELFESCRTLVLPKAAEKGLTLHFYAEPCTYKVLLGDPVRLQQTLVNLLINAIKFTEEGQVKLYVDATGTTENSVTILFCVEDSGIGMTEEQRERIFAPFLQAEAGTTRKYGGTGLGLAITKNIVEKMGGVLSVESTPEVGSKFSFEITFETVDESASEVFNEMTNREEVKIPVFEGEILICDDNSMNQQVICEHLARVGLKTNTAENGKIGVEMVKGRKKDGIKQYDLIFMDIHMPVMDGLEATEKILKIEPEVPIVAITANIMSHDIDLYKEKGMKDHVGKPFTSQELWQCLMRFMEPVSWRQDSFEALEQADYIVQQKLIDNFVRNNKDKADEISSAINAGDTRLAYMLTHSLKGNAGQLNKHELLHAAEVVESRLNEGSTVTPEQITALKTELFTVITELMPLKSASSPLESTDTFKPEEAAQPEEAAHPEEADNAQPDEKSPVKNLLKKVRLLIEAGDIESLELVDDLNSIPDSKTLIKHIENFDYDLAKTALTELEEKIPD